MSLFAAEVAVFVYAAGEEVLHQAGLDALLFGDQGFRLRDGTVYCREKIVAISVCSAFGGNRYLDGVKQVARQTWNSEVA